MDLRISNADKTSKKLAVDKLEQENQLLKQAVDELAILNDLAIAISGSLDSEKIMRSIISRSIRALKAEQGDITLVADNTNDPTHTLVRSIVSTQKHSPLHLNQNLLGWMHINKKALRINDPAGDSRFKRVNWDESVRAIISAPLLVRSKLIGILTVYNKDSAYGEEFTQSDKRLLSIIAAQSAQIVDNARLYEEEQAYKFMQKELELASNIQKKLLPETPPTIAGYSLAGKNVTAQAVGGDYFDYIAIRENIWALCLGDISGKGLPASLLMANLQAILRSQTFHLSEPGEILKHANKQLFQSTGFEKFATLFLATFDSSNHTLRYSLAGHENPYLIKNDGSLKRLKTGGIPLGMMEDTTFEEDTITLLPGETLFVYSDGVTDTTNTKEEMFGESKLEKQLTTNHTKNNDAAGFLEETINSCLKYAADTPLFDDITALVLKRNP